MKKTEINSIFPYLKGAKILGFGSTAICFLMPDNRVLRVYLNTYTKQYIFRCHDMISHLEEINSEINNDSFIGPEELLIKNDECVAYIYPYIYGKTIYGLPINVSLIDLFSSYDQLVSNTKYISSQNFLLKDVHDKNIMFDEDNNIKIIDIERGSFETDNPYKYTFNKNMHSINNTILLSIFGAKPWHIIEFYNFYLEKLYRDALRNPEAMYTFLEKLTEITNGNPTKGKLRRLHLVSIEDNPYYRRGW